MLAAEVLSILAADEVKAVEAVDLEHLLAPREGESHGLAGRDTENGAEARSLRA